MKTKNGYELSHAILSLEGKKVVKGIIWTIKDGVYVRIKYSAEKGTLEVTTNEEIEDLMS